MTTDKQACLIMCKWVWLTACIRRTVSIVINDGLVFVIRSNTPNKNKQNNNYSITCLGFNVIITKIIIIIQITYNAAVLVHVHVCLIWEILKHLNLKSLLILIENEILPCTFQF